MTRRPKFWLIATVLFAVFNFAGGVMAAAMGEPLHAGVHGGLMLLSAYYARRIWRRAGSEIDDLSRELPDRLTHIQQSVDSIALEVERIGEAQRFITRVLTENGAAEPIEINARDTET